MSETAKPPVSAWNQVRAMPRDFWVANVMEAFERLAFFGVRAVLPLYMVGTKAGAIGLTMTQKGVVYLVWALVQCLLPMVSGGFAEAYGYRASLLVAFTLNIAGYCLMANAHTFAAMMTAALFVATGTAIFKPPVQGTVARTLGASNSGLGFGIFYWVVNVGGFLAPMAAATLRGNEDRPTWSWVFYGAAVATACNFVPALLLFREPPPPPGGRVKKDPMRVFADTMLVLWKDAAMLRFLLVVSGFWFMFMQLWDLLPNFIDEWVDARDAGAFVSSVLGSYASGFLTTDGSLKPEMLINIDSAAIIVLVLPLSWFFGRFRMMTSLVLGMAIALVGFLMSGATRSGSLAGLGIFVFAVGEIICSPKFSEYIGMTAPPDKKALYMGYSNIPFAIGWAAGNGLSGWLYDTFSSRAVLARRLLQDQFGVAAEAAKAIKDSDLTAAIAARLGGTLDDRAVNALLWKHYHPWVIWLILGAVGLASVVGMTLSYRHKDAASPEQSGTAPAA